MISTILFNLCLSTAPISAGQTANCTGILWSIENTRNALKCKKVQLPKITADLELCKKTKAIEIEKLETKLGTAQDIIDATPPAAPPWVLPAASVGSFLVGALSMALLAGAL